MHKVLLEDASGRRAWGVEEGRVEGVREGMNIGAKMVLKGCGVARGVVMLGPATASVMGGRIEEAHKAWMEGRMDRVRREIEGMKE
ncbi:hypothetical protein EDC01DRAFT_680631 [Geopyxis carbonaria]|nr:hypothetical protein EDC01DRAFT_680631 [Geopyxis carbonaria]